MDALTEERMLACMEDVFQAGANRPSTIDIDPDTHLVHLRYLSELERADRICTQGGLRSLFPALRP
jgi:hypothetical protein